MLRDVTDVCDEGSDCRGAAWNGEERGSSSVASNAREAMRADIIGAIAASSAKRERTMDLKSRTTTNRVTVDKTNVEPSSWQSSRRRCPGGEQVSARSEMIRKMNAGQGKRRMNDDNNDGNNDNNNKQQ